MDALIDITTNTTIKKNQKRLIHKSSHFFWMTKFDAHKYSYDTNYLQVYMYTYFTMLFKNFT